MFLEIKSPNESSIFNFGNIQIQERLDARRYMFTGILEDEEGNSQEPDIL